MTASKFWSPTLGMGMLELAPESLTFTPDNGSPLAVQWSSSHTGQASQKRCPRRKADQAEWWHWITVTSRSGDVFSFRRGGAATVTLPALTCQACGSPAAGVFSSSLGAISFAYCAACNAVGAEPYGFTVGYVATCSGDTPAAVAEKATNERLRAEVERLRAILADTLPDDAGAK